VDIRVEAHIEEEEVEEVEAEEVEEEVAEEIEVDILREEAEVDIAGADITQSIKIIMTTTVTIMEITTANTTIITKKDQNLRSLALIMTKTSSTTQKIRKRR